MAKVIIDPGHAPGNANGGKNGYKEYASMWKLSNYLKAALERCGIQADLTRTEQQDPPLASRGAKAKGYDLFISEHSNAANGTARGVEVFYSVQLPSDKTHAAVISKAEAALMGNNDRGAKTKESTNSKTSDYYTVMSSARSVGCPHVFLAENGFHDNAADEAFLLKDENLKKLAEIQCEQICKIFGIVYVTDTLSASKTPMGIQAAEFAGLSIVGVAAKILELVKPNAIQSGLFPSVKAAQLILESDYLRSELAVKANNGYGMKKSLSGNTWPCSAWNGSSIYTKATEEQRPDGTRYTVTADFRKYSSIEDSIADHSAYLLGAKNGSALRYAGITEAKDYKAQIAIIKDGGYSTDVNYVAKVCSVIEKFGLDKYDKETGISPEEATVNNAIADGVLADRQYWLNVLQGKTTANPEYIKVVFDRYHALLS